MGKHFASATDLTDGEVLLLSLVEKKDDLIRADVQADTTYILEDDEYPSLVQKGYAVTIDGAARLTLEGKRIMKRVNFRTGVSLFFHDMWEAITAREPKRPKKPYPSSKMPR